MLMRLRRIASHVPAGLTFLLLGGLGLWGVRNDWRVPYWGKEDSSTEEVPSTVEVVPDPSPASPIVPKFPEEWLKLIRFSSTRAVDKAGIKEVSAETRALAQHVTANATLDYLPSRYVELHSPVAGRVWSVEKELGEPVGKGEVLAVIDATDVGRAKADFLLSLTQVSHHKQVLQRLQSARAALPERSLLEEQTALRDARIRLLNDQQKILNLGLHLRLTGMEDMPEEQASRQLRLLGLPEKIRSRVDPETLTANLLPLTAPFDGQLVSHPHAAPGQVVGTLQDREPLFTLADTRELHIDIEVHSEDVRLLRIGQTVEFLPANEGGTPATGVLAHISPEVNEKTRNVLAHAEVANSDGRLRPHTFGTARVVIRRAEQAVVVPSAAVQTDGSWSFVFVKRADDTFQVRPVETGLREHEWTEVRGVQPDEKVVATGSYVLRSALFKERIVGGD